MKIFYRPIFTMLALYALIFATACPPAKVNKTIRSFQENSTKAKIYANKIRKANRESFDAKDLSVEQFKPLTAATKKFSDTIKALDAGIDQAEFILRDNPDGKRTALDMLDRILNEQVVKAFDDLVAAISGTFHPVSAEVDGWLSTIRIALAAMRAILADVRTDLDGGAQHA